MSVLGLWLNNVDQNFIIDVQLTEGAIAIGWKLFCREDALRFEANIDQNFVLVDTHDHALDDIAALDVDGAD